MFGYVRALEELDEEIKSRYHGAYCGLCHTLGRRYGFFARFTLNYDFALLAMLFAPLEPRFCARRCIVHPFRKRRCCVSAPGFELAADQSIILFYRKLEDDVADRGFLAGLPARLASWGFRRAYRKAVGLRPGFDVQVGENLSRLGEMERAACPSMDRTADAFACILRAAVPDGLENRRARALGELLYHLGRWVYLIDAWDDLAEDREKGTYNPLLARFRGRPEDELNYIRATLTHSVRLCQAAFQLEEFGSWTPVLEHILYRGLPGVQEEVLSGRWKKRGAVPRIRGKDR